MEGLVLVVWALLVDGGAVRLQRGPGAVPQELGGTPAPPGLCAGAQCARAGRSPVPERPRGCPTGGNLTCYKCFKVPSEDLCVPTVCSSTDRVCVSHAVIISFKLMVKVLLSRRCAPRCPNTNTMYEWQWATRRGTKVLTRIVRGCCSRSLCNAAPPAPERPGALPGGLLCPLGLGLLRVLL
ncbi:lymphocyte antigen 6L isoform X1 [Saccopteryx leptura]|uniref:lymphocyte antigen 6L isoform X1 n=1 Tax=Saccopteryx leptura TaxID=249018 RepID=UPI00339D161D